MLAVNGVLGSNTTPHRWIIGIAFWLTACGAPSPRLEGPADAGLKAVWVELGPDGAAIARAIASADACPSIVLDGKALPMAIRVLPGTAPLRSTVSAPADSKPSAFPVTVCEMSIPIGTMRATIGVRALPLPKAKSERIVVLGDSGCRLYGSFSVWQGCDDPAAWPFASVAATAAGFAPDLVIHVGDYHYRENACPAAMADCRGSPWGYGWDAWQADFFEPAAPLLAAGPWVVLRGNHEECARAGQGWFRFLDPRPFETKRSCDDPANDNDANYSPSYGVPIGADAQLIVFDSAKAGYTPLAETDPQFRAYRDQFDQARALASRAGVPSVFASHHPLLGFVPQRGTPPLPGNAALLSVARTLFGTRYFPDGVELALHGHIHDFQAIGFASGQPATLIAGIGGDYLDVELPDPFPPTLTPAAGVVVDTIVHNARFGFVLLERKAKEWRIAAYTRDGRVLTRCMWSGPQFSCDRTGQVAR